MITVIKNSKSMARTQCLMVGGTYRTEAKCRFWSDNNKEGYCVAPTCVGKDIRSDIDHILSSCPGLSEARGRLINFMFDYSDQNPAISSVVNKYAKTDSPLFVQYVLDCSCLPEVVSLCQTHGQYVLELLFKITRTFCHGIHKARLVLKSQQYVFLR